MIFYNLLANYRLNVSLNAHKNNHLLKPNSMSIFGVKCKPQVQIIKFSVIGEF